MAHKAPRRAWVTLLTRPSYLPGVITLAFSLRKHATAYQLIVLITPSLPESCLHALELEAHSNPDLTVHPVEPLLPSGPVTLIAARFEDTWTKLRAFELTTYDACVFLDADITIYKNMDEVFDTQIPGSGWIAANQACVCNLDHDSWAPDNWNAVNCPYTPLSHPASLIGATPVPASQEPPHTHTLMNGGLFLYYPSADLWSSMLQYFECSKELSTYQFPDQDFLAQYFLHRWRALPWKYNALKTMENWHPNIWRDDEVRGLHYIVDKPWERRVGSDGIGGHLGRDGKTHSWWWNIWNEWTEQRKGEPELLRILEQLVAAPLDEHGDKRQCNENRQKGLPVPLPDSPARRSTKKDMGESKEVTQKNGERPGAYAGGDRTTVRRDHGTHFPVFREQRLGERGKC
ncbi:MAG: hypothetical protein Q9191_006116 [Dirinaria sp. TL-2023a]